MIVPKRKIVVISNDYDGIVVVAGYPRVMCGSVYIKDNNHIIVLGDIRGNYDNYFEVRNASYIKKIIM